MVATVLATVAVLIQALLALLLLLALASLFSARARALLVEVRETLRGGELWIAWAIALVATGGSLFFSEYSDFVPCQLCWLQRIAMYPLVVVLLGAAIRRDARGGALYAMALPVLGAMVAIWHIYVERNPDAEGAGCRIGAPCSVKWIEELGYVTLPTLALTAFAAIAVLLGLALWRTRAGPAD